MNKTEIPVGAIVDVVSSHTVRYYPPTPDCYGNTVIYGHIGLAEDKYLAPCPN